MSENDEKEQKLSREARCDVPSKILSFIHYTSRRYKDKPLFWNIDREDLINAGVEGFLKAEEKFDASKEFTIETFSRTYIQREIQKEAWKAIVGEENARYAASVAKAKITLEENGDIDPHHPNITQISRISKVPEKRVKQIIAAINFRHNTLGIHTISVDDIGLDAETEEFFGAQEDENEEVPTGQDSHYSEELRNQSNFHGEEYIFIFPELVSLLEKRDEEDNLMTNEQRYNLLAKLSEDDLIYEKRLALKRLALSRDDEILALSDSLFSLKSQTGENDVYQKRKMWKQQEEVVLKEAD